MALSEREQKLLEQMERALYAEDPQFASALQRGRRTARSTAAGVILALAGVSLLFAGLTTASPVVGVAGFSAMVAGVAVAMMPRKSATPAGSPAGSSGPRAARRRSFGQILNDRWDRRTQR